MNYHPSAHRLPETPSPRFDPYRAPAAAETQQSWPQTFLNNFSICPATDSLCPPIQVEGATQVTRVVDLYRCRVKYVENQDMKNTRPSAMPSSPRSPRRQKGDLGMQINQPHSGKLETTRNVAPEVIRGISKPAPLVLRSRAVDIFFQILTKVDKF
jgi:hypothetical protein